VTNCTFFLIKFCLNVNMMSTILHAAFENAPAKCQLSKCTHRRNVSWEKLLINTSKKRLTRQLVVSLHAWFFYWAGLVGLFSALQWHALKKRRSAALLDSWVVTRSKRNKLLSGMCCLQHYLKTKLQHQFQNLLHQSCYCRLMIGAP